MAHPKNVPEFEIKVGGEAYVWRIQRQPQRSSDTGVWSGVAIAVRHLEGKREAVIEFPAALRPRFGSPLIKPSQISADVVTRAIGSAMAAGWEPLSRGKTVAIVVDATGA
jgi:hypothetical protein